MTKNDLKNTEAVIRALNHEIGNPLTALKGFVQLLDIKKHDPEKVKEYSIIMLRQISEIEKIFNNVYNCFDLKTTEFTEILLDDVICEILKESNILKPIRTDPSILIRTDVNLFKKMLNLLIDINDVYENSEIHYFSGNSEIQLQYKNLDFSTLNSNNFFVPYSSSVYFRDGSSLYTALQIASMLNIELCFIKEKNMISVKLLNV